MNTIVIQSENTFSIFLPISHKHSLSQWVVWDTQFFVSNLSDIIDFFHPNVTPITLYKDIHVLPYFNKEMQVHGFNL